MNNISAKHAIVVGCGVLLTIFLLTIMYYAKDRLLAMEEVLLDSAIGGLEPVEIERFSFIGSRVTFVYSTKNRAVNDIYDHYCTYFLNKSDWYEGSIDRDELISCSNKNVDSNLYFCARDDNTQFIFYFIHKKDKRDLAVNVFNVSVVRRMDGHSTACNN